MIFEGRRGWRELLNIGERAARGRWRAIPEKKFQSNFLAAPSPIKVLRVFLILPSLESLPEVFLT